jgi:hypothetical protein
MKGRAGYLDIAIPTAKLRIKHDQTDCPIRYQTQADQQNHPRPEPCTSEGVGQTDNPSAYDARRGECEDAEARRFRMRSVDVRMLSRRVRKWFVGVRSGSTHP